LNQRPDDYESSALTN